MYDTFCTDAGHTTPVVNVTDGSSPVSNWHLGRTTESTSYNVTTVSSSANSRNHVSLRNESNITDTTDVLRHYLEICPSNVRCDKLGADCIDCEFNSTCRYGANVSAVCHVKLQIVCLVCTPHITKFWKKIRG